MDFFTEETFENNNNNDLFANQGDFALNNEMFPADGITADFALEADKPEGSDSYQPPVFQAPEDLAAGQNDTSHFDMFAQLSVEKSSPSPVSDLPQPMEIQGFSAPLSAEPISAEPLTSSSYNPPAPFDLPSSPQVFVQPDVSVGVSRPKGESHDQQETRKRLEKEIKEKTHEEEQKKKDLKEKAKDDLKEFYQHRQSIIDKRKALHREKEKEKEKEHTKSSHDNQKKSSDAHNVPFWQKVCQYIDFPADGATAKPHNGSLHMGGTSISSGNPNNKDSEAIPSTDLTSMKKLLLALQTNPDAPN